MYCKVQFFLGKAKMLQNLEFCVCSTAFSFFTKKKFRNSVLVGHTVLSYRRSPVPVKVLKPYRAIALLIQ